LVLLQQQEKTSKRYGWTGAQYTTQLPITVAAPCPSCEGQACNPCGCL
jgi:hypothetical protein